MFEKKKILLLIPMRSMNICITCYRKQGVFRAASLAEKTEW